MSSVSIHEIWEAAPTRTHNRLKRVFSPGPCALRVRRVNLTHKVISVKIFTLSLCSVFLLMQIVVSFLDRFLWILETESISSNAKKFCGIIFALSKDMLQCSENILIGHSCFFVNRYVCSQFSAIFNWSHLVFCDIKYAFSCSSANGRAEHIVLCHLFRKTNRKVSRCLYEEVEAPSTKLNSPTFGGIYIPHLPAM